MDDKIAGLDAQIAKLRSRKASLVAKRTHARRRRDAHCKILIGGALLALVDENDPDAVPVYKRTLDRARQRSERDAADLDAWLVERSVRESTTDTSGDGTHGGDA